MRRIAELAGATSDAAVAAFGAVRRVAITLTSSVLWQFAGVKLPDNGQEVSNAEPFTGIGAYARPPGNGAPEAIVVMVGRDGNTPVIVAVRDQATRATILNALGGIQPDETLLHNSQVVVYLKADGTIEARAANGAAVALALKSDVANAKTSFDTHTHTGGTLGGGLTGVPGTPMTAPVGTTILKGQ